MEGAAEWGRQTDVGGFFELLTFYGRNTVYVTVCTTVPESNSHKTQLEKEKGVNRFSCPSPI